MKEIQLIFCSWAVHKSMEQTKKIHLILYMDFLLSFKENEEKITMEIIV